MSKSADAFKNWKQGDFSTEIASIPILASLEEFEDVPCLAAVVVTQTCDVIRDYDSRPFVQVAAAVSATPEEIELVRKHKKPRYAYIPALASQGLIVDLDVVVTVDKAELARWPRSDGCASSDDERSLAYACGRHRNRFAFPETVSKGLSGLRSWIEKKGRKDGEDGQFIKSIEQIRLDVLDLENPLDAEFICIVPEETSSDLRETWANKIIPKILGYVKQWCPSATVSIRDASQIILADYQASYRLDFNDLTRSTRA